jgi:hypothetical protein
VATDPHDGSLLITQTARIYRLMFPPGPAVSFQVDAPANVPAGTPFDVTITALDAYGRVASGYTGTLHFTSADPYGATSPADYPFTAADHGAHTFPGGASLYTAGTWDVTATDSASGITGTASVTVTPAPAVALIITAPTSIPAGVPFDLTVTAVDAYGNTATDYRGTVSFTTTDTGNGVVLPSAYTFTADDQGAHTFTGGSTLVSAGDQLLTATDWENGLSAVWTLRVDPGS